MKLSVITQKILPRKSIFIIAILFALFIIAQKTIPTFHIFIYMKTWGAIISSDGFPLFTTTPELLYNEIAFFILFLVGRLLILNFHIFKRLKQLPNFDYLGIASMLIFYDFLFQFMLFTILNIGLILLGIKISTPDQWAITYTMHLLILLTLALKRRSQALYLTKRYLLRREKYFRVTCLFFVAIYFYLVIQPLFSSSHIRGTLGVLACN